MGSDSRVYSFSWALSRTPHQRAGSKFCQMRPRQMATHWRSRGWGSDSCSRQLAIRFPCRQASWWGKAEQHVRHVHVVQTSRRMGTLGKIFQTLTTVCSEGKPSNCIHSTKSTSFPRIEKASSKSSTEWFKKSRIHLLEQPRQSLHLNLAEILWNKFMRAVHTKHSTNVSSLKQRFLDVVQVTPAARLLVNHHKHVTLSCKMDKRDSERYEFSFQLRWQNRARWEKWWQFLLKVLWSLNPHLPHHS